MQVVCTPGLEFLINTSQLLVKQKIEFFESCFGVEGANKYEVYNNAGEEILKALSLFLIVNFLR